MRVGGGGECDVVAWCLFVFVCDGGSVSGSVCVRADSLPTKMAAVLLQSDYSSLPALQYTEISHTIIGSPLTHLHTETRA